jgi:glycyl-tRNA synthetase beta chain
MSTSAHPSASSNHQFLLEVGTEELPASFQASAQEALKAAVQQSLDDWGLTDHEAAVGLTIWVTPRRLMLKLDHLPAQQADKTIRLQGPAVGVAQDANGQWTKAAEGFARKQGVELSALGIENGYVVLSQTQPGKPLPVLLTQAAPQWILGLPGSHFMRWGAVKAGERQDKFSRPIRWVLSLWNDNLLPLAIAGVTAQAASVGHRLLGQPSIPITAIDAYEGALAENGVTVNPAVRLQHIQQQLAQAAQAAGGVLSADAELLETINALVEAPHVVTGHFDPQFLSVPDIVLTTVMKHHQKYAAVYNTQQQLLPVFLAVGNARPQASATIAMGNERVLTARFYDAAFFYEEDMKTPLADRVEALAGLTFQKGLGTLKDKADRLVMLAGHIATALKATAADTHTAERAALLCKADLTTGMVRELTELQGEMGAIYAVKTGETPAVGQAIKGHYYPRFSGDDLPNSLSGTIVSLADKIDTLLAVFSQPGAKLPSGSKDPLGLRRMANGLWQILWAEDQTLDLYPLLETAYQQLKAFSPRPLPEAMPLLQAFLHQRLNTLLLEADIRLEWAQAVTAVCDPLADLAGVKARLQQLQGLCAQPAQWQGVVQPATRVARLLASSAATAEAPALAPAHAGAALSTLATQLPVLSGFSEDVTVEQALIDAVKALPLASVANTSLPEALLTALASLQTPVNNLFDQRMINDPNPALKAMRLQLVNVVHTLYRHWADFSQISDSVG